MTMFQAMDTIADSISTLQDERNQLELDILGADTTEDRAELTKRLVDLSGRITAMFVHLSSFEIGCLSN